MLIVVRHGRTEANASGRLLGRDDPVLDELGRRQAAALRDVVADAERPRHGRLQRRHVGDDHHVVLGRLVGQVLARRPHARAHVEQRLAAFRGERQVRRPPGPQVARHVPHPRALELAVVELDPALVDGDGEP